MTGRLTGTFAALLSGFADDGAFSPARQGAILDYVTSQTLTGLYVGGSSGEDGLMNVAELEAQQAIVAEHAQAKSMTLIAHVGRASLRESIQLAKHAEGLGYQALSALPPHAYPHSDEEIFAYYKELSAATSLPLIAYEIPVRTHRALSLDLLQNILDLPNVTGLKFTSTDLFKMSRLRSTRPDSLIYYGFDEIFITGAVCGAHGGIGTTYNVLGSLYTALFAAVQQGDLGRSQELQQVSQDFVAELVEIGVIPGVKLALQTLGVDCGPARAPLSIRVDDAVARMNTLMARDDIRQWVA